MALTIGITLFQGAMVGALRKTLGFVQRVSPVLMLVAGSTWPEELGAVRQAAGDLPLLVPGVGAQGGDPRAVLECGADSRGRGLVVNASRSVIFASVGADFREAARQSARALHKALRLPR